MRVVAPEFRYADPAGEFMGRLIVRDDLGPAVGKPLREWTAEYGWVFELDGPDGRSHLVSLERWRETDPDRTFIAIAFHGLPLQLYRERIERGERPFRDEDTYPAS